MCEELYVLIQVTKHEYLLLLLLAALQSKEERKQVGVHLICIY